MDKCSEKDFYNKDVSEFKQSKVVEQLSDELNSKLADTTKDDKASTGELWSAFSDTIYPLAPEHL